MELSKKLVRSWFNFWDNIKNHMCDNSGFYFFIFCIILPLIIAGKEMWGFLGAVLIVPVVYAVFLLVIGLIAVAHNLSLSLREWSNK